MLLILDVSIGRGSVMFVHGDLVICSRDVMVAEALRLPFAYARPKPKEHGKKQQIEGAFIPGQTVVVVKDLISTGKSCMAVIEVLRESKLKVVGAAAIFSYGFEEADRLFGQREVPYFSLSDYETLLEEAARRDYITKDNIEELKEWRKDPATWGPKKKK